MMDNLVKVALKAHEEFWSGTRVGPWDELIKNEFEFVIPRVIREYERLRHLLSAIAERSNSIVNRLRELEASDWDGPDAED